MKGIKTEALLAGALVVYLFVDRGLMAWGRPAAPDLTNMVVNAIMIIVGFYFGSSKGSRMRTEKETGNGPVQEGVEGGQGGSPDPGPATGVGGTGTGGGNEPAPPK